ncbi:30S ribosome-binding factor RbfA [Sandaracinobacteroides hominis]|uniref:30S ribosome-binding factor RbfA n=1 Tax=Sandaracinobacteroides hominis TaxID=2780086 RepID=UPI0018F4B408|nr:30S ribosome-binding factor RbfA [Sandaracinobacteroides hominis]
MKRSGDKKAGSSVRTLKVGEAMRHILADLLARGDIQDDVLAKHIVSVSEVRVSPDLRHATAFIMPVGASEDEQTTVLKALNSHAKRLKGEVARRVNTKYAAEIHFKVDDSYAEAARIDALLRMPRVSRDLEGRAPPSIAEED